MECQVGMDIDADDVCAWAWTLMQTCLRVCPCIWANGGRWWSPSLGQKKVRNNYKNVHFRKHTQTSSASMSMPATD
eukprot:2057924-Lingulodinium_polyedra.AAC.1